MKKESHIQNQLRQSKEQAQQRQETVGSNNKKDARAFLDKLIAGEPL